MWGLGSVHRLHSTLPLEREALRNLEIMTQGGYKGTQISSKSVLATVSRVLRNPVGNGFGGHGADLLHPINHGGGRRGACPLVIPVEPTAAY